MAPLVDRDQARQFISALGKNGSTRMRGFFPTGHPLKSTDPGKKDKASHDIATKWQPKVASRALSSGPQSISCC